MMNGVLFMTDDPKPIMSIGFFTMPIITTNFITSEDGTNAIGEELIRFCADVYKETSQKLHEAACITNDKHGVITRPLTQEEIKSIVKQAINREGNSEAVVIGIVTPEGKVIEDEHAVENLVSGRSFDN